MTTTNRDWETLIEELRLHNREHNTATAPSRLRSHRIFACNICYKKSNPASVAFRNFYDFARANINAVNYIGQTQRLFGEVTRAISRSGNTLTNTTVLAVIQLIDSLTIDSPPRRPKIVFVRAIPSIIYNTQGFTVAGNTIYSLSQQVLGSIDNEGNPIPELEKTTYTRSRPQTRAPTPEETYTFGQEESAWGGEQEETQGETSNNTNREETQGETSNRGGDVTPEVQFNSGIYSPLILSPIRPSTPWEREETTPLNTENLTFPGAWETTPQPERETTPQPSRPETPESNPDNISRNRRRRIEVNQDSEEDEEELVQELNNRRRLRRRLRRAYLLTAVDWNQSWTQIQQRINQENLGTFLLGLDGAYRGTESSEDTEDSLDTEEETDEEVDEPTAELLLARLRRRIERSPILLEIPTEATWEEARQLVRDQYLGFLAENLNSEFDSSEEEEDTDEPNTPTVVDSENEDREDIFTTEERRRLEEQRRRILETEEELNRNARRYEEELERRRRIEQQLEQQGMSQRRRNRNNGGGTGTGGGGGEDDGDGGGNGGGENAGGGNDGLNNVLAQLATVIGGMNQPGIREYNVASCGRFSGYDGEDPTEWIEQFERAALANRSE